MNVLNRLFVEFGVANRKPVAITFLITAGLILLLPAEGKSYSFELFWNVLPIAVASGFGVTFLVFWPIWILKVRKEAARRNSSFRDFVMSDEYRLVLRRQVKILDS